MEGGWSKYAREGVAKNICGAQIGWAVVNNTYLFYQVEYNVRSTSSSGDTCKIWWCHTKSECTNKYSKEYLKISNHSLVKEIVTNSLTANVRYVEYRTCCTFNLCVSIQIYKNQISIIDPYADQWGSMRISAGSILINKDLCRSMRICIDLYWSKLIFIDPHRSA